MHWMTHYPAKRLYDYFMSMDYFDFDMVLKFTKDKLFSGAPLMALDGFFDKESQIWVINPSNKGYVCLVGAFNKTLQLMEYTQQFLTIENIREKCMLDGTIQLMYYKITSESLINLSTKK